LIRVMAAETNSPGAAAPAPKERLTRAQKWSAALSVVGALVCLPAAGLFGAALGY
jgi:hypothetical protein